MIEANLHELSLDAVPKHLSSFVANEAWQDMGVQTVLCCPNKVQLQGTGFILIKQQRVSRICCLQTWRAVQNAYQ